MSAWTDPVLPLQVSKLAAVVAAAVAAAAALPEVTAHRRSWAAGWRGWAWMLRPTRPARVTTRFAHPLALWTGRRETKRRPSPKTPRRAPSNPWQTKGPSMHRFVSQI